jgi:hypothetical protein
MIDSDCDFWVIASPREPLMSKEGISAYLTPADVEAQPPRAQSRDVVEGTLAGRTRSAQKGASTEFADHRAYMPAMISSASTG